MTEEPPAPEPRVSQLDRVKQEYTAAAREILQRSMRGVAKTKLTPDMLTLAGVSLCLAGAVLVGFEQRNEKLYFWLGGALFVIGSVADILDGALARAASKGTVFGAFLDSTFDRLGEAAMLTAIGLVTPRFLLRQWRYAIVGAFLVTAIITPGDVITAQLIMGVPMTALYFASVGLSYLVARRPRRDGDEAGEAAAGPDPGNEGVQGA